MNRIKFIILIFLSSLTAEIRTPIFLLHGFLGWGRDEMDNFYYWGGKFDLQNWLIEQGYEVYTLSVGPVSSNWDRAIEAYYQIKGGQVNYGVAHSEKYGLIQKPKGKVYEGMYPKWDENNPIHIISHSQGGQTALMLEYLLKMERVGEDSEILSKNYKGYIKSITTISAPLNGTTLTDIVMTSFPMTIKMAVFLGAIYDDGFLEKYYNFDLDQWGLSRNKNETIREFLIRINKSSAINSKNLSQFDLSFDGSMKFNQSYISDPNVHYFSYSTFCTKKTKDSNKHLPDLKMNADLWLSGTLLGTMKAPDSTWYQNDGIVNTISMSYPFRLDGTKEPNCEFIEKSIPGCWQLMGQLHIDHHQVIGHGFFNEDIQFLKDLFGNHCNILKGIK